MYYVLGILSGVLIAFIAVVLQERMKSSAPQLMRLAVTGCESWPRDHSRSSEHLRIFRQTLETGIPVIRVLFNVGENILLPPSN